MRTRAEDPCLPSQAEMPRWNSYCRTCDSRRQPPPWWAAPLHRDDRRVACDRSHHPGLPSGDRLTACSELILKRAPRTPCRLAQPTFPSCCPNTGPAAILPEPSELKPDGTPSHRNRPYDTAISPRINHTPNADRITAVRRQQPRSATRAEPAQGGPSAPGRGRAIRHAAQRSIWPDAHGGHDKHEGHTPEMFRNRFWYHCPDAAGRSGPSIQQLLDRRQNFGSA